jgi:NAD(P)-dependent dehydrogenase (short-subunit alcohol dehydrogenase family)
MKKLENKVAIITGAGSGIGKEITLLFAREGCKIIASDISETRINELSNETASYQGNVKLFRGDITNPSHIDELITNALNAFGTIDVLVNNAGIMDNFEGVDAVDEKEWSRVFEINLNAPYKLMQRCLKIFLPKKTGNIINIASIGGLNAGRAGAAYTSSKFALIGLTKNTGYLYAKKGIRCNAIAPGAIETHISESIDYSKLTDEIKDRIMPGMALNPRYGKPIEIAKIALFLTSEDSSLINGSVIVADDGWSAY